VGEEKVTISDRQQQIMGAQNFKFTPNFLKNGGFTSQNLVFNKNFQQGENFRTS